MKLRRVTRNKGGGWFHLLGRVGLIIQNVLSLSEIITPEGFSSFIYNFFSPGDDSLVMADAITMINRAADLCFSNKFLQAKAELEPW